MQDFIVAVSIPLALFISTFVIGTYGLGRVSSSTPKAKRFWLLFLGCQITLAFVSYFGLLWLPMEFIYFGTLLFCVVTIGMLVFGLLALICEKRPT